jgi:hypothetical protein
MFDPADGPDSELARSLRSLGRSLDEPHREDVVDSVRAAIDHHPRQVPRRRARRLIAAAIGLGAVLTVSVPGMRTAVAHFFGIGGVSVTNKQPDDTTPPVGAAFFLGDRVTLEQARNGVAYPVLVPSSPGLGTPEVYLRDNGIVSFVYPASTELPAAHGTSVGLIVTQFNGDTSEAMTKLLDGSDVAPVSVNGQRGLWLTGRDHFVFFVDQQNGVVEVPGHIAGNTLLWEQDGVTVRIEANISEADALLIAESVK